jgi:hypothetical protein
MTDAEILEVLERILRGEGDDDEVGEWIEKLERATRCPHILSLIRECSELDTPETILRKAREYKPFEL